VEVDCAAEARSRTVRMALCNIISNHLIIEAASLHDAQSWGAGHAVEKITSLISPLHVKRARCYASEALQHPLSSVIHLLVYAT
jgi:hypothetical protein